MKTLKRILFASGILTTLLALLVLAVNTGVLYLWNLIPGMPVAVCKLLTEICIFFEFLFSLFFTRFICF